MGVKFFFTKYFEGSCFISYAFYFWAIFAFLSNSALSLFHVLLLLSFLWVGFFTTEKKLRPSYSMVMLFVMCVFCIASVVLNLSDLVLPMTKLIKVKYLLLGLIAALLSFSFSEKIIRNYKKYFAFFLISFMLSAVYGVGRHLFEAFVNDVYYKPSGFFGMVMSYAYTAVWPILLVTILSVNQEFKFNIHKLGFLDNRLFRYKFLVLSLCALYLSQARGAILGYLVALPFLFLFKSSRSFVVSVALSALVIGAVFFRVLSSSGYTSQSEQRIFQPINSSSNQERLSQFQVAWEAFKSAPFLGVGWRSLEERSTEIKNKHDIPSKEFSGHAHNNYLEVLSTTGILGFLSFILWILFWIKDVLFIKDSFWRSFYIAGIVGFLVSGLFQSTIIDSEYAFTLFALYGLSSAFKTTTTLT